MKRIGFCAVGMAFVFSSLVSPAQTNPWPNFDEVYQLLRANAANLSETELNRAAVRGLLEALKGRVILSGVTMPKAEAQADLLPQVSVLENAFAYFRVGQVAGGLDEKLARAYHALASSNKLKGVVLDLRFAGGTDYTAAAKTADLFLKSDRPLLHWGENSARATAKKNPVALPVAVLVNGQTASAAEALAGILRETQAGLILGTNTAGLASVFKEFKLNNGQILKIASVPIKLGNGKEISGDGLVPDIEVAVSAEDEKAFYENPYRDLPKIFSALSADTNNFAAGNLEADRPRRRLNEADLVRLQREGLSPEQDFVTPELSRKAGLARAPTGNGPLLSDPVLIRALDILKGLAIVQRQAEVHH